MLQLRERDRERDWPSSFTSRFGSSAQRGFSAGIISHTLVVLEGTQIGARHQPLSRFGQLTAQQPGVSSAGYGGDFLVANLPEASPRQLELILVDVCGKGVGAASRALYFGGALGELIGALPPRKLFPAASDFLLRQHSDEAFATGVPRRARPGERGAPADQRGPPT